MTQPKINSCKIKLTLLLLSLSVSLFGQQQPNIPVVNWQNMDLKKDKVFGISTEKAYNELLKGKPSFPVIVAVIDGGVDINHQDLKPAIWTNLKETPNNNKDDDKNGYVDDVHGWNFMGSSKGSFIYDNKEYVRLLRSELKKDPESIKAITLRDEVEDKKIPLGIGLKRIEAQRNIILSIVNKIGKETPSITDFEDYKYNNEAEAKVLAMVVREMKKNPDFLKKLEERYQTYVYQYKYMINVDYDPRQGNAEFQQKFHGNGDVKGAEPSHGTHVAGIIAAFPHDKTGVKGVCAEARIMVLRAIPYGDPLDSDMASAIRYAADNGAKVINLSTGKTISPDQEIVDDAVKYAIKKDVLIIHGAGNDAVELKEQAFFPCKNYKDGGKADAWIEVGASGPQDDESLLSWFSNYGKNTVDVFAPGEYIYSTYPNNEYEYENGTSMSAPMVSGLAALIRAYYPKLNALQVKDAIMNSVVKINHSVKNRSGEMLNFSSTCVSGGVVNAFNALKLADKMSSQ